MSEILVLNASPTIVLAKIKQLELLTQLADECLLPEAVVLEILAGPPTDPARRAIESGWGQQGMVEEIPAAVLEWGLGAGESAVIALALRKAPCTAVLDDMDGRRCARTLKVPIIGTLGVILRAKQRGLLEAVTPLIHSLRGAGLYLNDTLLQLTLPHVGEQWPPGSDEEMK